MMPLAELIPVDRTSDIPVYLQIANSIIHAIRRGQMRRSLKLPGSREIAAELGVHRKTAQSALDELMAQGWIEIVARKGTFVVNDLPEIKPARIDCGREVRTYPATAGFSIDSRRYDVLPPASLGASGSLFLDDGLPDVRLAPIDLLIREYRSIAKRDASRKYLRYGGPRGAPYLLDTLSNFLNETRGLPITSDNLLVTRGAQMGFYLAAQVLLRPGDNAVVGSPGYLTATATFLQAGVLINRVAVDDSGIDVDAVQSLCRKKRVRLVYVIPHHHYPTTVTLTPERRIRLLELAGRYKFAILEDDYDYDFDYNSAPLLPMASLDSDGSVIYVGTLAKTFIPAIRMGFMVAPHTLIDTASRARRIVDWQGDTMMEVAMAELYRNGTIARHIRKVVRVYRERRDHFCEALTGRLGNRVSFRIPQGGMSVWARFPSVTSAHLAEKAARLGLAMSDSRFYDVSDSVQNAARLGFASLNFREQDKIIEILKECV